MKQLTIKELKSLRGGINGTDNGPRVFGLYNVNDPDQYIGSAIFVGGKLVSILIPEAVSEMIRDGTLRADPDWNQR